MGLQVEPGGVQVAPGRVQVDPGGAAGPACSSPGGTVAGPTECSVPLGVLLSNVTQRSVPGEAMNSEPQDTLRIATEDPVDASKAVELALWHVHQALAVLEPHF